MSKPPVFTAAEKSKCALRELHHRRRAYPRWIVAGRYTQEKADFEIAIMSAILSDYANQAEIEDAAGRLL